MSCLGHCKLKIIGDIVAKGGRESITDRSVRSLSGRYGTDSNWSRWVGLDRGLRDCRQNPQNFERLFIKRDFIRVTLRSDGFTQSEHYRTHLEFCVDQFIQVIPFSYLEPAFELAGCLPTATTSLVDSL